MSIFLQNFVQITQGARIRPVRASLEGGITLLESADFAVRISRMQLAIIATTVVLVAGFSLMISKTSLGRTQRACAQDQMMVALLGVDVDRVIATTFVLGAGLAAVAGLMVSSYYGVVDFSMGFLAGMKAFTAAVLGAMVPCTEKHRLVFQLKTGIAVRLPSLGSCAGESAVVPAACAAARRDSWCGSDRASHEAP
jgi:branched-chain amino acid transport system permease protein